MTITMCSTFCHFFEFDTPFHSFRCVQSKRFWTVRYEALPGVLGNRGKGAFISGEQGNKGQILRGTGEQRQFCGTGNIRKQIFDFGGTGEQASFI